MGGDGGVIAANRRFMRAANMGEITRKPKAQKSEQARARWATCAITQQPLKTPIVCCRLGNLYWCVTFARGHLPNTRKPCQPCAPFARRLHPGAFCSTATPFG